jgi:hypothetical protein
MNLKDFLEKRDGRKEEYYWALVIEPGWIQAGIWEIANGRADVISISPPAPWQSEEEMVGAADTALSAAIQSLPTEGIEPTKTVFGVIPSWVADGQITSEHLLKIKKLCTELSLEPCGFVVLPEAIAHLLKFEEGAPANAIILGIGSDTLDVAVFKLGNLMGTTSVARSVSLADDVFEGLTRFAGGDLLPSRFLIYDGKEGELEEDKQALLAADWEGRENIKFLHTPKVEIVSPQKKVLAAALAGASEIANVSEITETKKEPESAPPSPEAKEEETVIPVADSSLGFAVGEDIAKTQGLPLQTPPPPRFPEVAHSTPRVAAGNLVETFKIKINGLKNSLLGKFRAPPLSGAAGGRTFTWGLIFLVILFFGLFALWWYYPTADATIYVSGKKIEEKAVVSINTQPGSSDLSKLTIPGETVKTTVSGDKTKSTSGTKLIGDKAKGAVKIENGTASAINFPAGTIIASSGDLRFTTSQSASVSAALSPGSPGTATVEVTAADIGADYNLAKDEIFKVGNYPKADVDAVSTADFSGGSSRQISAVSAEDQKSLLADEESELLEKAKEELLSSVSSERYLITESLTATPSSFSFSAKVGDEAGTLKLSLSENVSGISSAKSDLYSLGNEILKGKVPEGFVLRNEQLTFSFVPKSQKGSVSTFELTVLANLLPEINPQTIAQNVAGKYPDTAEDYLNTIPGFARVEFKLKPRLPGRLGTLPRVTKHISIEIVAER